MTTPIEDSLPEANPRHAIGPAMASFLAGDPLRSIAAAANMSSYGMLRLLGSRVADRAEKTRSKAIRDRCIATGAALYQERERFEQLMRAGIDLPDIPRVLTALGAPVDVDIAVEMLRSTRMFKEILHRVLQQNGVIEVARSEPTVDLLSLLYVTGLHRGVDPDYELALGMMPVSSFSSLRELLGTRRPYQETAEILAVIEATSQAIRAGDVAGISISEYDEIAEAISRELKIAEIHPGVSWPAPGDELRRHMGQGSWDAALDAAGLNLFSGRGRFSNVDFVEAARGFRNDYDDFGSPKEVSSYDSWVIAETAAGRERPSAIAIRRHFGTWESVIGAVMPAEIEDEYDGIVNHIRAENDVQTAWAKAGELISEVLANMPWNSFLSIQYADVDAEELTPYAQAVPSADGVWFEIVSAQFLPAENWPISASYLTGHGWSAPDNDFPNWYKDRIPHIEAGHQILEGLRYGRGCHDANQLRWHTGEFPTGPGPDGGVTLDDALNGIVQTLSNAA
ncbi:TY-Chap domain-containing protein [Arthrobacter sp. LAR12-1-1.1]|uniref:TY-Chap domain-containing protein n=1 Tax=Arthrobacter sp. LAR12-1-1.1 TaxID=3135215 RepID=UPI003448C2C8